VPIIGSEDGRGGSAPRGNGRRRWVPLIAGHFDHEGEGEVGSRIGGEDEAVVPVSIGKGMGDRGGWVQQCMLTLVGEEAVTRAVPRWKTRPGWLTGCMGQGGSAWPTRLAGATRPAGNRGNGCVGPGRMVFVPKWEKIIWTREMDCEFDSRF
jgi:hypothetical protein